MTVTATNRKAGPYPGNGVATSFPFSFKVFAKTDIAVVFANSSGVESTLVLDSDYSVTLNADQNTTPGGSITYPISGSPMLSTQALAIVGGLGYGQTTALPSGGAYNASIVERALDRLTILVQQVLEIANRGVQLAFTTATNVSSRLPAPRAFSVLGWSSDGLSMTNYDPGTLGVSVSYANWRTKRFNGTGAQTAFVLDFDAGVASNCDVTVAGLGQTPDLNFSYDSPTKTITFLTGAPPAGTNNVVVRYGQALPQGSMTSAGITDATATGRSVLTAADAAAARTAIGAQVAGSYQPALGYTAADDAAVVKLTGAQTVAGVKTFSSQPVFPQAAILGSGAVATTSGTTVVLSAAIPAGVSEFTVHLDGVSTNGSSITLIQAGTAGGYVVTGYNQNMTYQTGSSGGQNSGSTGIAYGSSGPAAAVYGNVTFRRMGNGLNKWSVSGVTAFPVAGFSNMIGGVVDLGAEVTSVRLNTVNGTDTHDAGTAYVTWKGPQA